MSYISAKLSTKPTGNVISTLGNENAFVQFSYRWLGAKIELVATRTDYLPIGGQYLYTEIGRDIVDIEDASGTAADLQWAAAENLDASGEDYDRRAKPAGFDEEIQRVLGAADDHAIAAE